MGFLKVVGGGCVLLNSLTDNRRGRQVRTFYIRALLGTTVLLTFRL